MQKKDTVAELLKQREAITGFGRTALRSDDLHAVLTEACRLCSDALGTPLAKILEVQENGRELLVVAGVGWKAGVVGQETVPILPASSEGMALNNNMAVVSEDFGEEDRFDYPGFLKQHGVEAMVNVVIPGAEGRPPYGLLEVDDHEPRKFSDSDVQFLQGYSNILGAAVERHNQQRQLSAALEEKERLLEELQHRVRNNLSVLGSMLRIKSRKTRSEHVRREIAEVLSQIDMLAQLHRQLDASGSTGEVDLGSYLSALGTGVAGFASNNHIRVEVETQTESILVDAALAIPLGIVVNEFVTNSVKHGSADGVAAVRMSVGVADNALRLALRDTGPGVGNAVDQIEDEISGSGLGLIEGMLRQLEAEWTWSSDGGTGLEVSVPLSLRRVSKAEPRVA